MRYLIQTENLLHCRCCVGGRCCVRTCAQFDRLGIEGGIHGICEDAVTLGAALLHVGRVYDGFLLSLTIRCWSVPWHPFES